MKLIDNDTRECIAEITTDSISIDEALDLMLCINRANESRDPPERQRQQEAAKAAAMNLSHLLGIAQTLGYISLTSCNYLSSRALGLHGQIAAWIKSDKPH